MFEDGQGGLRTTKENLLEIEMSALGKRRPAPRRFMIDTRNFSRL